LDSLLWVDTLVLGDIDMSEMHTPEIKPGICIPWEDKLKELPKIQGDEELYKRIWEDNEAMAYMYIWQVLLSF
jgi:hypothetical protein